MKYERKDKAKLYRDRVTYGWGSEFSYLASCSRIKRSRLAISERVARIALIANS